MFELSHISKIYRNKKSHQLALDDVSFSLPDKGLVIILGASGCGKTTLLNLLSLLDLPTSGTITYHGNDLTKLTKNEADIFRSQKMGIIYQNIFLMDEYSVAENIKIAAEIKGIKVDDLNINQAMENVGLDKELLTYRVKELSGGQKQRIALLRTLLKDPEFILADEPTGSLDNDNAVNIFKLLVELSKEKLVVVVTHDEDLAMEYSDMVIKIEDGKIVSNSIKLFQNDVKPLIVPATLKEGRTHFSFANICKLGASIIYKRVPRFLFTLLTFFICLSAFSYCFSTYFESEDSLIETGIKDFDTPYFLLHKDSNTVYTKKELEQITETIEGPIIYSTPIYVSGFVIEDGQYSAFSQLSYLTEESLKMSGCKLYGELPQDFVVTSNNEVVITIFDCIMYGFLNQDNFQNEKIINEIIGNKISLSLPNSGSAYQEFRISGILDTNYIGTLDLKDTVSKYPEIYYKTSRIDQYGALDMGFFVTEKSFSTSTSVKETTDKNYNGLYMSVASNYKNFKKLVKEPGFTEYSLTYPTQLLIDIHLETQVKFQDFLLLIGLIFLALSLLNFSLFSYNTVMDLEKSLRILRSLGCSFKDSLKAYTVSSVISSILAVTLSIIPYLSLLTIINNKLQSNIIPAFALGHFNILIVFFEFLAFSLIGTFISWIFLKLIYKKKKIL